MTKLMLDELQRLEAELLVDRESLRQKFSVDKLTRIEAKATRLDSLRTERDYDNRLQVKWRQKFPEITDDTFAALWQSRLKDEAMIQDAVDRKNQMSDAVAESLKHPVYSAGFDGD